MRLSALFLLICYVPCFTQTITNAQSQDLRTEALSLKNDLTVGNYELALQKIGEMNLVVAWSPKAKDLHENVAKMSQEPASSFHLAPAATTPLLPLADKLLAAIDSGVRNDVQLQIRRMIDTLANTYRAEQKTRAANVNAKPGTELEDRSLALSISLDDALAKGQASITQAVSIAMSLHAVLDEESAQHLWMWGYTSRLYKINDALGRSALAKEEYIAALQYLQKQTELPDDKQNLLCCFGPNLWLAQQLLKAGYTSDVLSFLQGIKKYWTKDTDNHLDGWIADIQKGNTPDMSPNNLAEWGYKH